MAAKSTANLLIQLNQQIDLSYVLCRSEACMQILTAAQRSCTKLVFLYFKICTLNRNFPINSTTHIWIKLNVMTKYHRPPSTTILNIGVVNSNFRVPL
jgi:hypothetical protein